MSDLPGIIRSHPDNGRLLKRMMTALGLDLCDLSRGEPETLRDLGLACNACRSIRRCASEISQGTAGGSFRTFCPNASRLEAIQAMGP